MPIRLCPYCGSSSNINEFCSCCGKPLKWQSNQDGSQTDPKPISDNLQNNLECQIKLNSKYRLCEKCHLPIADKLSKSGYVWTIIGLGFLCVLAPLTGYFIISIFGFIFMSIGLWRQANPKRIYFCPQCGCRYKI